MRPLRGEGAMKGSAYMLFAPTPSPKLKANVLTQTISVRELSSSEAGLDSSVLAMQISCIQHQTSLPRSVSLLLASVCSFLCEFRRNVSMFVLR